ncbi:MAG: thioredoxin domain-containing protein [Flammeovirgaceae bacterium]
MNENKPANRLINASSPYLLQHAYNPVDWYPWGKEALTLAQKQDRPIIVSIGYSACHWCHVMERESFENEQVAEIMNTHYVCIKVDREERPDIDQIYMEAVQLMGINGGWPLNVILMPNGKPFYGGTYFPPQNWANLLLSVAKAFRNQRDELEDSANSLAEGVARSEVERFGLQTQSDSEFSLEALNEMFEKLASKFDLEHGGMNRAPKFPMPAIYSFLLRYYQLSKNEAALNHLKLSLNELAYGGIYDQIGGGFARYSVDAEWFAPHFEKMLYDNAQLLSIYAEAYTLTKDEHYQHIVAQTVDFLVRELQDPSAGFYAALDADSEGIEGKFYIWTYQELQQLIEANEFALFEAYYHISPNGNWEDGQNILHRRGTDQEFAQNKQITVADLSELKEKWAQQLLEVRASRVRPGLDDKQLTSWNGLLVKGLCDTYQAFNQDHYLQLAITVAQFIDEQMTINQAQLLHNYKDGKASIPAYLEDYAAVIQAYVAVYQSNFDEKWLAKAKSLTDYTIQQFWDEKEGLFFFTDKDGEALIARKKELFDNVIPASNSIMATNLFQLGLLLENSNYTDYAEDMIKRISNLLYREVHYLCNWAALYTYFVKPTTEIAIIGEKAIEYAQEMRKHYLPNCIFVGTTQKSELPLLKNRTAIEGKTTIYVCQNKSCQLPVTTIQDALKQLSA